MKAIVDLVYRPIAEWDAQARNAFATALSDRYVRVSETLREKKNDERRFQLRVNADATPSSVPYAALIAPDQELTGGYGGMSFVMFPSDSPGTPAVISMGVGTNGLAPDDAILGRPGHGRKCAAISSWLNTRSPGAAWAKQDPVRIDLDLPSAVRRTDGWERAWDRYGKVLYATFIPGATRTPASDAILTDALTAFIDLFFDERRIEPKKAFKDEAERIRRSWMARVLPGTTDAEVAALLTERRYAIIEGPPGTGKTEMAGRLLSAQYANRGRTIQFHPGTTYESFVGGLAPREGGNLGFTFRATRGHLMEAAAEAAKNPASPYLLVIDEINRADLAKVLGEAIHLLEPDAKAKREVTLAHDFEGFGRTLKLPANLHILGTMNSADRSIAILDVAVRRRFAFVPLWPQLEVVEKLSGERLQTSFHDLLTLFVEHASDDALPLTPGHAYFLGSDAEASRRLATSVRPLLEEYLAQGYVAGFADEIRAYIDRIAQVG